MRTRRILAAVAVLPLALTLGACGEDKVQGEIVSKAVDPGYDWLYMQPMYSTQCGGKPTTCRSIQTGSIPIWYHVPTCYKITVNGDTSGHTCLNETRWNALSVGDDYTGPDVDAKDRKVRMAGDHS